MLAFPALLRHARIVFDSATFQEMVRQQEAYYAARRRGVPGCGQMVINSYDQEAPEDRPSFGGV